MSLYIINNNFLIEECHIDFATIFNENSNGESTEQEVNNKINNALGDLMGGEDVAADMVSEICVNIQSITDPTWLEKKQYQLEEKLRKYEEKLKSDKTGTFAKIWTRVKQFFVKILAAITKAINKAVRFVKQKVAKRKIKNMMKNGDGLF